MDQSTLTNWGSFLSGIGTLFLAVVGLILVLYDIQIRRRQLRETRARSNATLNVEIQTHLSKRVGETPADSQWILETRVLITNVSTEVWAIPAVYIHARAVPRAKANEGELVRSFSEVDFDCLEKCGTLSQPLNVAAFPTSVFFLSPGEADSVVRWDVFCDSFARQFSAIVIRVEIFSVIDDAIGASYGEESHTSLRNQWLTFMQGDGTARYRKVIFSAVPDDKDPRLKKGSWAILQLSNQLPDYDATHKFEKVLAKMSRAGRQALVVLEPPIVAADATRGSEAQTSIKLAPQE